MSRNSLLKAGAKSEGELTLAKWLSVRLISLAKWLSVRLRTKWFWVRVQLQSLDRIHLTENGEVLKTELKIAETLNNFFGNVIKKLMIPKYSEYDLSIDRVENRTIRAVLKYRNHPSILAIRERKKFQISFCFKEVSIEEIQKEILNLNNKKAFDIPTKIIKENSDTFGKLLCSFINDSVKSFTFLSFLKDADVTPIHKMVRKIRKKNIGQSALSQSYQKYLKEFCLYKCLLF